MRKENKVTKQANSCVGAQEVQEGSAGGTGDETEDTQALAQRDCRSGYLPSSYPGVVP